MARPSMPRPWRASAARARGPVYLMSLLAIELEDEAERRYLRELATQLRLDHARVDALHRQIGAPSLH